MNSFQHIKVFSAQSPLMSVVASHRKHVTVGSSAVHCISVPLGPSAVCYDCNEDCVNFTATLNDYLLMFAIQKYALREGKASTSRTWVSALYLSIQCRSQGTQLGNTLHTSTRGLPEKLSRGLRCRGANGLEAVYSQSLQLGL